MIIQVHTDPNIESSPALTTEVEALVAAAVGRFGDRVSRVQVHLGDENSRHKGGSHDKRCMMEVRMDGRPPIAVVQQAATLDQAMTGAADKLERSIDSMLGRLNDR
jgi:ribosome-associated translation inhibitor RaiA